jgi:nicotinamide-nucleotide amidase
LVQMNDLPAQIIKAAAALGHRLARDQAMLVCAESCTGGMIAMALTETAGSSAWFERGLVTYSNQAKIDLLAVDRTLIDRAGAVSEAVAVAMAQGALASAGTGAVQLALSVTGIAGPSGAVPGKPVGTVCFGFAWPGGALALTRIWSGDRSQIRQRSALFSLQEAQRMWLSRHSLAPEPDQSA